MNLLATIIPMPIIMGGGNGGGDKNIIIAAWISINILMLILAVVYNFVNRKTPFKERWEYFNSFSSGMLITAFIIINGIALIFWMALQILKLLPS